MNAVAMRRLGGGLAVAASLVCWPGKSHAQVVEVTPFVGYRFGGELFERITEQSVYLDGARALGAVVNVKFNDDGLFAEALFTHQEARLTFSRGLFAPPVGWRMTVNHWQGGGRQEFGTSPRARPFLTGLLGLTHYAAEGDNEIRFTASAGGGVKLMPVRHIGVRLDSRCARRWVRLYHH